MSLTFLTGQESEAPLYTSRRRPRPAVFRLETARFSGITRLHAVVSLGRVGYDERLSPLPTDVGWAIVSSTGTPGRHPALCVVWRTRCLKSLDLEGMRGRRFRVPIRQLGPIPLGADTT